MYREATNHPPTMKVTKLLPSTQPPKWAHGPINCAKIGHGPINFGKWAKKNLL